MDLEANKPYAGPYSNSPLLALLLVALSAQKNVPKTVDTFENEYDYIIVGAGSGGATLAGRLSEKECASVLLIEAGHPAPLINDVPVVGRFFWNTDMDWQYKTVPQKHSGWGLVNKQVAWPSGKALGGSSSLNAMLYVRGNKKNYDDWSKMGADGWSYKDVLPYFKKAENNTDPDYVANGFHGVGGPLTVETLKYKSEQKQPILDSMQSKGYKIVDPNGPRQTGIYSIQATFRNGTRCSTAKAYLVPAENRTNLAILPNAFARKVLIEKGRATGVEFHHKNQTHVVKAKREVILSAGTVNTAQLLMLSGIGPKQHLDDLKIPVVADLPVGNNFHDHISTILLYQTNISTLQDKLLDPKNIDDYIQHRTGPLASPEMVSVVPFLRGTDVSPDIDYPLLELYFSEFSSDILHTQTGLIPEYADKLSGPYKDGAMLVCFIQANQPKSRGTVRLASTDPFEPPLIDPNYLEHPEDVKVMVNGMKLCNEILLSEPLKKIGLQRFETRFPGCEKYDLDDERYLECYLRTMPLTLSHQVGSATMGNIKEKTTVVDPQLRVKGIEGLRVVDASVMPLVPSGNTNVPTIMVAEKAADIIKKTIRC